MMAAERGIAMGTARKANLGDVARLAEVSQTTASRFFNDPSKLRPGTRARIAAAVATLDFVPNMTARALALSRSHTVGAILPTFDHALFAREMGVAAEVLAGAGYALVTGSGDYEPAQEFGLVRTMIGRGVDGLFLVGLDRDPAIYDLLTRKGIPFVTLWSVDRDVPHPQVGVDHVAAARAMADHVLSLGHRRVAIVEFPLRHNDRARARMAGFRAALDAAGLRPDPRQTIEAEPSHAAGAKALHAMMAQADPPTAILCGGDVFAIGILLEAQRMGVSVPRDLSVTGFDDQAVSALLHPPLTTVDMAVAQTGRAAARHLLGLIAGEAPGGPAILPHRLILRGSTAPPSAR